MAILSTFLGWWRGLSALAHTAGEQRPLPNAALDSGTLSPTVDGALQQAIVWNCIERRANVVAALPFFAYNVMPSGQKELARASRLYMILHESPNPHMTPFNFWRAMMMNHDLRGNAYARIDRDEENGEAIALWPMPADQVTQYVLEDGTITYVYRFENNVAVLHSDNVLHLKNLGNGITGLSKLEFMRSTLDVAHNAQKTANRLYSTEGKPTGLLMIDKVLTDIQRAAVRRNFEEMQVGGTGRLFVLEADMKYQQLSLSPEDQQLLQMMDHSIEDICRWFDVPPVLAYHSNVTTWGSGVEQILDGWYKLVVRAMLVSIEQEVRKKVFTSGQRARMSAEFSLDALLRGNTKDRFEVYAKAVQNGLKTRNEIRQLENDPPSTDPGADKLTAQSNLMPLNMLGKQPKPGVQNDASSQDPVAQ